MDCDPPTIAEYPVVLLREKDLLRGVESIDRPWRMFRSHLLLPSSEIEKIAALEEKSIREAQQC